MKDYWVTFKAEGYVTIPVCADGVANAEIAAYHIATDKDFGELEHVDFNVCSIEED